MLSRPCGHITFLTDLGDDSPYIPEMKKIIAEIAPKAVVTDVSHDIPEGNVKRAAKLIANTFGEYPFGTVHVVIVDSAAKAAKRILCVRSEHYFFLAPDNGVLTHVLSQDKPHSIIDVANRRYFYNRFFSKTFRGRYILAPVAAHLASGLNTAELGREAVGVKLLENTRT